MDLPAMQPPHPMPPSPSDIETLRTELRRVLEIPPDSHRNTIIRRHPPLDDVLAGKCPVVLYPAANMASAAAVLLQARGVDVRGFSDKDPTRWGQTLKGLPIVSPVDIATLAPSGAVLVASSLYDSAIREYLAACSYTKIYSMPFLNFRLPEVFVSREYFQATEAPFRPGAQEAILQLFDLLADDTSRQVLVSKIRYYLTLDKSLIDAIRSTKSIYFDSEVLMLSGDEVFADAGAYIGDTLNQFLRITGGLFRSYEAFEPDPGNCAKLQQAAAAYPQRVHVRQAAVTSRSGQARFRTTSGVDAKIVGDDDLSGEFVPVVSLDDYFYGQPPPTLIKMDIEGSEAEALRGATNLIKHHQPILAVSIYHYASDLWSIPRLIHELNPHYRLMIRHYTREIDDTVCYALPPRRQTA